MRFEQWLLQPSMEGMLVTIELTPRGKRVRSVREHVQLCCGLFGLHYLGCFCPGWFWRGI